MKKIIPVFLVMLGLILVAIPIKFFNPAKTTKYEPVQTNIWLPAKTVIIRGRIMPDLYFDSMVAPTKVTLADFKSGFPEGGVVTYPEFYDGSNRRLGATVWHSDRDGRLYFTNQPAQKPDYLPWYVDLQLEIKDGKLVANPVQELGLLWFLSDFVGISLLVLSVMLWRL